jgi:hypothetical protein
MPERGCVVLDQPQPLGKTNQGTGPTRLGIVVGVCRPRVPMRLPLVLRRLLRQSLNTDAH